MPINSRRHPDNFFERAAEIIRVVITDARRNFRERQGSVNQQALRLSDSPTQNVLLRRVARRLLEGVRDVTFIGADECAQFGERKIFGVVFFDVIADAFDDENFFLVGVEDGRAKNFVDDEDDGAREGVGNRVVLSGVTVDEGLQLRELLGVGVARNARTKIFRHELIGGAVGQF